MEGEAFKLFSQWGPLGVCSFFIGWLCWWLISRAVPAIINNFQAQLDKILEQHRKDLELHDSACERRHAETKAILGEVKDEVQTTRHSLRDALQHVVMGKRISAEGERGK